MIAILQDIPNRCRFRTVDKRTMTPNRKVWVKGEYDQKLGGFVCRMTDTQFIKSKTMPATIPVWVGDRRSKV